MRGPAISGNSSRHHSCAREIVRNQFALLPMVNSELAEMMEQNHMQPNKEEWHIFGKCYQYLSTPVNTKELSLMTSLPRRDVPGLRFFKTAVRFANNPAEVKNPEKSSDDKEEIIFLTYMAPKRLVLCQYTLGKSVKYEI